ASERVSVTFITHRGGWLPQRTEAPIDAPASRLALERSGDEREHFLGHGIVWHADRVVERLVRGLAADDLCRNPGCLEHGRQPSSLGAGVWIAGDMQDEEGR